MNLEWLTEPLGQRLTLTLAHFFWQGCALALVLAVVLASGVIRSAARRYVVAVSIMVLMLISPVATFFWLGAAKAPVAAAASEAVTVPMENAVPEAWLATIAALQPYVVACWVAGLVLMGARLLVAFPAIGVLRRESVRLPRPLAQSMDYMNVQLGQDAVGKVYASGRVSEATVVGLLRPMVLLPLAWLSRLPAGAIEAVVAHELGHIRRFDLWTNLLQRVVETVLFFHPAVWWVSRRATLEREMCCDEFAVALIGRRDEYALALEAVARQQLDLPSAALGAAITGGNMNLLKRVRNVLGISTQPGRDRWLPVGVMALSAPVVAWVTAAALLPAFASVAKADGEREKAGVTRPAERPGVNTARREGQNPPPATREGAQPRAGARDGEGARTAGPRDGEGVRPAGPRDGQGVKAGPRDGQAPKTGARDGQAPKTGPRDGEGVRPAGARDGQAVRTGPRDGEGVKTGPREVPGQVRPGMREGQATRTGPREGEGVRPAAPREGQGVRPAAPREGQGVRPAEQREGQQPRAGQREGVNTPRPAQREGAVRTPAPREGERKPESK
jgi:beta-lactamase regulating signal transducer with metallopeptidase domain